MGTFNRDVELKKKVLEEQLEKQRYDGRELIGTQRIKREQLNKTIKDIIKLLSDARQEKKKYSKVMANNNLNLSVSFK